MTSDLINAVHADQWVTCRDGLGAPAEFWPVVDYGEPRCALGLARYGAWAWCEFLSDGAKLHALKPPALVGVLPLLELPFEAVVAKARQAASSAGVQPERIERELPSRMIVEAAVASRSGYWVDLAVQWLAGLPYDAVPVAAIEQAAHDAQLPQRSRHALLRALADVRNRWAT